MNQIIDIRGSKKTYKLMLKARENNGIVVCANPYAMQEKSWGYGLVGVRFISYTEFIELRDQELDINKYYIDELETFMEFITLYHKIPGKIDGYTLTLKDEK